MKSKLLSCVTMVLLGFGLWQCEDVAPPVGAGPGGTTTSQVQGRVYDNQSRNPLINSTVYITSTVKIDSVRTAADGGYSFSIDLGTLTSLTATMKAAKNGYRSQNFDLNINQGATIYQDFYLDRDTVTGVRRDSGTGLAHSIALVGVSSTQISVFGVGGVESSILIWEVRDSLGFPIDIDHRDTVNFALIGNPGTGGAYVSPGSELTNVSGRVATTVNSGTVSGVLQFIATLRRDSDGHVIQSTPVLITVNAGLPDQAHFTIGPVQHNFAGYDWLGVPLPLTVQVGDMYSNPVKTGTAVYFNTTGGVVAASGFTDPTSHATVILYSGNPLPKDPTLFPPALWGDGTGYGWVRAYTLGENGADVKDSSLILFSGVSTISASTYTISVPRLGSQDIVITIADENGNPLAPGTVVRTELTFNPPEFSGYFCTASGLPEDAFSDHLTRGPGTTQFTLHVADGTA